MPGVRPRPHGNVGEFFTLTSNLAGRRNEKGGGICPDDIKGLCTEEEGNLFGENTRGGEIRI